MLVDVGSDKEFQDYCDRMEQRLHNRMFPILATGIRLHMTKSATAAQHYVQQRGQPVLVRHYKQIYKDVYTATFHQMRKQARTGSGQFIESMLSWIQSRAARLIQNISQSTMDYIRDRIMIGVAAGQSNDKISRDIYDDANAISRWRAATIARTETHTAAMQAMNDTIEDQGIEVRTKTWQTSGDDRVRDSHVGMDGETVGYDEPFSNGMMFPGDGDDPDEVINCRCTVAYNTETQESVQE